MNENNCSLETKVNESAPEHTCDHCGKTQSKNNSPFIAAPRHSDSQKMQSVKVIYYCRHCITAMYNELQRYLLLQGTQPAEFSGETPLMKILNSEEKFQQYRKNPEIIKPPL